LTLACVASIEWDLIGRILKYITLNGCFSFGQWQEYFHSVKDESIPAIAFINIWCMDDHNDQLYKK
jgi:hypothetical protein